MPMVSVGPKDAFLPPPAGEGWGEGERPVACTSYFWPVLELNRHQAFRPGQLSLIPPTPFPRKGKGENRRMNFRRIFIRATILPLHLGAQMDNLLAARSQMAMSLAFHIIFSAIGI